MRLSFVQSTTSGDMPMFEPDEGFKMVKAAVKGFWVKMGLEEVLADNSDFYFLKIPGAHASSKILEGGPWLPYASLIGTPLYADSFAENRTRLDFARICIEVEAGKPFSEKVCIKMGETLHEIKVEYKWRPQICEKCKVFCCKCKSATIVNETLPVINTNPLQMGSQNASDDGTWVQVRGRNVRNKQKVPDSSASTEEPGNVVGASTSVNALDEDLRSPHKSCSGLDHYMTLMRNKEIEKQAKKVRDKALKKEKALRKKEEAKLSGTTQKQKGI
ncbi:hypothetical protein AKJ16_DCAP13132 [Drosera capensis]